MGRNRKSRRAIAETRPDLFSLPLVDDIFAKLNDALTVSPVQWTSDEIEQVRRAMMDTARYDEHFKQFLAYIDYEYGAFPFHLRQPLLDDGDVQFAINMAMKWGMSPDEAIEYWWTAAARDVLTEKLINKPSPIAFNVENFLGAQVRAAYQQMATRISGMAGADQRTLLNALLQEKERMERGDVRPTNDRLNQINLSLAALSLYGEPEVRVQAIEALGEKTEPWITVQDGRRISLGFSPSDNVAYMSLDVRLLKALKSLQSTPEGKNLRLNAASLSDFNNLPPAIQESLFNRFIKIFSYTHTSENTDNVLGAAIQHALSQVGVNQEGTGKSFYRPGVSTPATNPVILELLRRQYERTQKRLRENQYELYRGVLPRNDFQGIPMSPWSPDRRIAVDFATKDGASERGTVYSSHIPKKYIFMTHDDPNWESKWQEEAEFLVMEQGYMPKTKTISRTPMEGFMRKYTAVNIELSDGT